MKAKDTNTGRFIAALVCGVGVYDLKNTVKSEGQEAKMCKCKGKVPPPPPPPYRTEYREVKYGNKWDGVIFSLIVIMGVVLVVIVKIFGGVV